ncbi:hypothetical protein D3C81_1287720 [compost metagenome]
MGQHRLCRGFAESRAGLLQTRNPGIDGVGSLVEAVVDRRLTSVGVVGDLLAELCRPGIAHACTLLAQEPGEF